MTEPTVSATPARGKPTLALLHGWGLGDAAWDAVVPALAYGHDVLRLSLPGYDAARAAPQAATPSFTATAAALAATLPEGTTLCGWSLGALLAMQIALTAPAKVRRLILVGATASFVQRDGWPDAQPPGLLDNFRAAVADDPLTTLQRFVALINQGDSLARPIGRALNRTLQGRALPASATLLDGLAWLRDVDLRDRLAALDVPTHLIHGERDPLMPLAAARRLLDLLPNATLSVMHDAAHAPFLHDPDTFAALAGDDSHAPARD